MSKIIDIKGGRSGNGPVSAEAEETREYNRIPWSGNLDEDEINRPGGLLLAALYHCANERRQLLNDMAKEVGVTYGYINQLRNGIRPVNQVSDDFTLACARYLDVPRFTVLMLSGRVTPEDVFESEAVMASEITRAMAFLCNDPKWGHMVTAELRQASLHSQYLLVRMYEEASGKKLMDNRLDPGILVGQVQKLMEIQAAMAKKVDKTPLGRERRATAPQS